jgi:transmembrane sensor
MNGAMLDDPDRQQADLMFARASCGEPAMEEAATAELERWAAGNPERTAYLQRLRRADGFLEHTSEALLRRLEHSRRPRTSRARWTGVGAVASVAALAGLLWWWNPVIDEYWAATAVGERRSVLLGDGSRVTLNTASKLSAQLRLRSRETVLEEGEALFEVASSAWRPFLTAAGDARIRVLGTIYSVRLVSPETRVSVVEGRVEVRREGRDVPYVLGAGDSLDTGAGAVFRIAPESLKSVTAWRDGKLVFDEKTVAQVLTEAARYRQAPIRLADAAAGQSRISGVFSADNVDALLRMLPDVASVTVTFASDGSAVVASRQPVAQAGEGAFTAPVPIDPRIR